MANLYPYIFSEDARQQAEFYAKALKGEIGDVRTFADSPNASEQMKDKVMHLVLRAADHVFFMADSEPIQRGNGLDLTLEYRAEAEARSAFEGLAEGGNVIMPFERMFWGTMFGRVEDRFGVRWQISTES
ncbi:MULTISPECIES: VOC family protein [unclassified Paenibacillus]|uniref:VOC family protein n=1 Tax=unclassified Paenibacillus TaxID=185978 RepID=UPI001AE38180|nr:MULTISPECIES: VOC family protein [unclassified Paenibacillus]MBP1156713.1 PhnB protein [Paenibacillus sp. PvP091]MBP1172549.1 PhnB protein [Paenibacillus sp. PvR098]MBP2438929.1 PhnB protein [Paenibacillus sp. PvP052]